eukprot:scaffold260718_cov41-Tisochrysis_lutea.AAC.1
MTPHVYWEIPAHSTANPAPSTQPDCRKHAGMTRRVDPIIVFQTVKIIAAAPEPESATWPCEHASRIKISLRGTTAGTEPAQVRRQQHTSVPLPLEVRRTESRAELASSKSGGSVTAEAVEACKSGAERLSAWSSREPADGPCGLLAVRATGGCAASSVMAPQRGRNSGSVVE